MSWTVEYHSDHRFVECKAMGFLRVDDLIKAAVTTFDLAREKDTTLVLVDDSKLERTVGIRDIYDMPQRYADLNIDSRLKVAVILPTSPKAKEEVQFFETVCRNRGLNISVFRNRDEAMDFLIKKTSL
ncbi:MAG: hypothetical protein KKD44_12550 [Proteobacteria bacterium]|nr:hypothetical protein [Pseudomonadota bacterium]